MTRETEQKCYTVIVIVIDFLGSRVTCREVGVFEPQRAAVIV